MTAIIDSEDCPVTRKRRVKRRRFVPYRTGHGVTDRDRAQRMALRRALTRSAGNEYTEPRPVTLPKLKFLDGSVDD